MLRSLIYFHTIAVYWLNLNQYWVVLRNFWVKLIILVFMYVRRRGIHYQSTGSLHSDSQSSSSVSPIPMSPAPSPTRPNTSNCLKPPTPVPSTNLFNSKKWSSTGDFNNVAYTNVSPSTPSNRLVGLRSALHGRNIKFANYWRVFDTSVNFFNTYNTWFDFQITPI